MPAPRSRHLDRRSRWLYESGASAVEYAVLVAVIAAIVVGVVFMLGRQTHAAYECTLQSVTSGVPSC